MMIVAITNYEGLTIRHRTLGVNPRNSEWNFKKVMTPDAVKSKDNIPSYNLN